MTSTKNKVFDLLPTVHMGPHEPDPPSPLWTSTCGRHEIALFERLVQWRSRPKAEIRLYDCNLFKTVLLVIYITNLYRRKISTFIPSKYEILAKKTLISLHEKKTQWRQWTLILIFCVDVHMGIDPPPPHPHASTWAWPPMCGCHKWINVIALLTCSEMNKKYISK